MKRSLLKCIAIGIGIALAQVACSHSSEKSSTSSSSSPLKVEVREVSSYETDYIGRASDCVIRWSISTSGENFDNTTRIQFKPCQSRSARRFEYLSQLIQAIKKHSRRKPPFQTWVLGRISQEQALPRLTLSRRLAMQAIESDLWDQKRGKPRAGGAGKTVAKIMKRGELLKEYREIFEDSGYQIIYSYLEKVKVAKVGDLPFSKWLAEKGANRGDLVPHDVTLWMKIKIKGQD